MKVGYMEGKVKSWIDRQFEVQDRLVKGHLGAFELRITWQLGIENTLKVSDIRIEIAEIKKIVTKLYERTVIIEPVMDTMIPTIEVPNI